MPRTQVVRVPPEGSVWKSITVRRVWKRVSGISGEACVLDMFVGVGCLGFDADAEGVFGCLGVYGGCRGFGVWVCECKSEI